MICLQLRAVNRTGPQSGYEADEFLALLHGIYCPAPHPSFLSSPLQDPEIHLPDVYK